MVLLEGVCYGVYIAQYPGNIPPGTAVPNWAYTDYTVRARKRWWRVESPISFLFRLKTTSMIWPQSLLVISQKEVHRFLQLSRQLTAL